MKCIHCGQDLIPEAKFCNNCGQPVTVEQPQVQVQAQPDPQVQAQAQYNYQAPQGQAQAQNTYQAPQGQQGFYAQQQAPQGGFVPPYMPGFQGSMPPPQPPVPAKGMGVAGMVLGIVSLVIFCAWYLAIPCAITGLVLSIASYNKAKEVGMKNNMALAGLVCSVVALGIAILFAVLVFAGAFSTEIYY